MTQRNFDLPALVVSRLRINQRTLASLSFVSCSSLTVLDVIELIKARKWPSLTLLCVRNCGRREKQREVDSTPCSDTKGLIDAVLARCEKLKDLELDCAGPLNVGLLYEYGNRLNSFFYSYDRVFQSPEPLLVAQYAPGAHFEDPPRLQEVRPVYQGKQIIHYDCMGTLPSRRFQVQSRLSRQQARTGVGMWMRLERARLVRLETENFILVATVETASGELVKTGSTVSSLVGFREIQLRHLAKDTEIYLLLLRAHYSTWRESGRVLFHTSLVAPDIDAML